jgi:threonine dehydrogenase-like Zn-dependent dehydrogenase
LSQYGHGKGTVHGGCSEYSIIPARYAYILKTDIDDNTACLLEPFGVAHQAMEGLLPENETVLVQGKELKLDSLVSLDEVQADVDC